MANQAQYAAVPKVGVATISTANANRDGTGTVGTVFTAGTNGSRIDRIIVKATGTTTAGMIRLFIHNGTANFLYREIAVTAITPSGTVAAYEVGTSSNNSADIGFLPLTIPSGYSLRAATNNAESFVVTAIGGDL